MAFEQNGAFIRNIAEVPWREFPNHFGGALSKPLVMPETAGARHLDYRISMYQPVAHVERHKHRVQEQIYHGLEGEGRVDVAGQNRGAGMILSSCRRAWSTRSRIRVWSIWYSW